MERVGAWTQSGLGRTLSFVEGTFLSEEMRERSVTTRQVIGTLSNHMVSNPLKLYSKLKEFLQDEVKVGSKFF